MKKKYFKNIYYIVPYLNHNILKLAEHYIPICVLHIDMDLVKLYLNHISYISNKTKKQKEI